MKRRKLSLEEMSASVNLKSLWNKKQSEFRDKHHALLPQLVAAEAIGFKSQGAFSHYVNGQIPLNMNALVEFSKYFEVSPGDIYPEMWEKIENEVVIDDDTNASEISFNYKALDFALQHYESIVSDKELSKTLVNRSFAVKVFKKCYEAGSIGGVENIETATLLKLVS